MFKIAIISITYIFLSTCLVRHPDPRGGKFNNSTFNNSTIAYSTRITGNLPYPLS